jgi:phosphohistidine phosphatase
MQKTVFLVRHAKSDWSVPVPTDHARPLNARGKRDAPVMAALMRDLGHIPDLIVSSDAVRALTTARVFATTLGIPDSGIIENSSIYESDVETILGIIRSLPAHANVVYLFGHNFTFSLVASHFSDDDSTNLPTCAVAKIIAETDDWNEFNFPKAQLVQVWKPKDAEF